MASPDTFRTAPGQQGSRRRVTKYCQHLDFFDRATEQRRAAATADRDDDGCWLLGARCRDKLAFHDADTDTYSPNTATILRPTHAFGESVSVSVPASWNVSNKGRRHGGQLAGDLRNRKQRPRRGRRRRPSADDRWTATKVAASQARSHAEVTPVIGVVERALNSIVFQQRATLRVVSAECCAAAVRTYGSVCSFHFDIFRGFLARPVRLLLVLGFAMAFIYLKHMSKMKIYKYLFTID